MRFRIGFVAAVFLGCGVIAARAADDATKPAADSVVYLLTKKSSLYSPGRISILARELYRQGLLIAARDGLGLQTRDESLREWGTAPSEDKALMLIAGERHIKLQRKDDVLWSQDMPAHPWWPGQIIHETDRVEGLSRGDLVKVLRDAGFSGKANAIVADGVPPADSEARLAQLDELTQFDLVRETHALIRDKGESPARLGVLVRAYANLGQLSRYQWSVEPMVFTARSLLYGQRMVAADPQSPVALWNRAYAMALAGLQGQAIEDLKAAGQAGQKAPAWAAALELFCNYDFQKLKDLANSAPSQSNLATYLAFVALEHSTSQAAIMTYAKAALDANPRCLRLIDAMCTQTGPGMLNELTEQGPQIFSQTLGTDFLKTPNLPEAVVAKFNSLVRPGGNPLGREEICQTLLENGTADKDKDELSLAAMGRMIQEITFAQTRRRANLIADQWGVDASDYVNEVRPLVAEHPFAPVIEAYGLMHSAPADQVSAMLKTQKWEDMTLAELELFYIEKRFQSRGPTSEAKIWTALEADVDATSFDGEARLLLYRDDLGTDRLKGQLEDLVEISPHSPLGIVGALEREWNGDLAKQTEKDEGEFPIIAMALAKKYAELKQWDDAARCWQKYIVVSPDITGYRGLAEVYRVQGQDNNWLATLKECLSTTDDYGLQHAQLQVEIAQYFMKKKDFDSAVSFADEAAATGASWGVTCAAWAHTGAGDFKEAEPLLVQDYQHYSSSPFVWFEWCVRTGHGDQKAALAALHQYFDQKTGDMSDEDLMQLACLDQFENKNAEAIKVLHDRFEKFPGPISLLHIIGIADAMHDDAERNAACEKVDKLQHQDERLVKLAVILKNAYQGKTPLDTAAADELISNNDEMSTITACYLTGSFLATHGQKEKAAQYLKRCYANPAVYCSQLLPADQAMSDLGLDPQNPEAPATQKAP